MSNTTTKYKPRPYVNAVIGEQLYQEEVENAKLKEKQKLEDQNYDPDSAGQDTQDAGKKATSGEATDYEKRYWDLKKYHDQTVNTLRHDLKDAQESSTPSFTPPKTAEELEKFRLQNPEFYDVIISLAHDQSNRSTEQLTEMRRKLDEMEQEKALALIAKAHPDFDTIVKDPKFNDWIERQSIAIQNWVRENSNDANAFIRALDLYKLDAGITKQTPRRKSVETSLDSSAAQDVTVSSGNSVTVGDSNKRVWSRAEIARMTPPQFAKFEEQIDEAMREGRIR
jgi:hypothetical protein